MPGTAGETTPLISESPPNENPPLEQRQSRGTSRVSSPNNDVTSIHTSIVDMETTGGYDGPYLCNDTTSSMDAVTGRKSDTAIDYRLRHNDVTDHLKRNRELATSRESLTSHVSLTSRVSRHSQISRLTKLSFAEADERITLSWEKVNVFAPPPDGKVRCPCGRPPVDEDPKYTHILRNGQSLYTIMYLFLNRSLYGNS